MSKAREALERDLSRRQQGNAQELAKAIIAPASQSAPSPAPALAVVAPPAPPKPTVTVSAEGIALTNPTIELGSHYIMTDKTSASQTNKLTPKEALIVHGAVVVKELGLILPLEWCLIRS